jgi:hypothetical protein
MTQQYYYTDVIATAEALFLTAGIRAAPDAASSVILGRFADGWGRHNVPEDFMVSATYLASENRFLFLGKYGLIKSIGGPGLVWTLANIRGRFQEEYVGGEPGAVPFECIRAIDGALYACGWNGQLYVKAASDWRKQTGRAFGKVNLLTICGTSRNNVFVAGMAGVILHYDGAKWSRLDSPTNAHLYCSTVLSSGKVLLAGANGGIYVGDASGFKFVGIEDSTDNFWSAAEFKGEVYLAASKDSLWRGLGKGLTQVHPMVEGAVTTYRLSATGERLFSAGPNDILEFDGSTWNRVDCPENR